MSQHEAWETEYQKKRIITGKADSQKDVLRYFRYLKKEICIDGSGRRWIILWLLFSKDFNELDEWPIYWSERKYYYGIFTTLLDYATKSDHGGGYFSIETRYPFQDHNLFKEFMRDIDKEKRKQLPREYLLEETNYGKALAFDKDGIFNKK